MQKNDEPSYTVVVTDNPRSPIVVEKLSDSQHSPVVVNVINAIRFIGLFRGCWNGVRSLFVGCQKLLEGCYDARKVCW
jgi:hypothetical protein